jgi:signal transduction histidine kinase/DNA-binding response OmpR family regulator
MAKILIVDDNVDDRELLVHLLTHFGHEVTQAVDGSMALELALASRPDLVITDLMMPVIDGHKLAALLRQNVELANVPIVFLSATYHVDEARALAKTCRVQFVMEKPAEPQDILKVVGKALDLEVPTVPSSVIPLIMNPDLGLVTDILRKTVLDRKSLALRIAGIAKVGMSLPKEHDPIQLLKLVCGSARDVIVSQTAAIGILDRDGRAVLHYLLEGAQGGAMPQDLWAPKSILSELLSTRRPVRLQAPRGAPEALGLPADHPPIASFLAVPVASKERVYGWLSLANRIGTDAFSEEDERLAVTLAGQASIAYENLEFHTQLQRQAAELEQEVAEHKRARTALEESIRLSALEAEVVRALNHGKDLRDTLQQCAAAMVRSLDGALARIWAFDETEQVLELQASAGMYTHIDGPHGRIPIGKFKIGLIAQERKPHLSNSVIGDPRVHDQEWAKREGLVAFAGYPLVVEDRLVGVMAMFARKELGEQTLAAMGAVANGIAMGIERKHTEMRLLAAKEAAEAGSRAKSEFLAVVSHELRTPLNGIFAMTGILDETTLDDEQREFVDIARRSADHLLELINGLLDFAKIESRRVTLERNELDLLHVIEEVVDLCSTDARKKQLDIILHYSPAAPRALIGDAGRIRQIVANLVSNAIKFTSKGHVMITVECTRRSEHEADLFLSVQDTGIGIPAEQQEHIFDKFTQVDSSSSRRYEGIGMGLAICKELTRLLGGDIGVRSHVGKGSTFWLTLTLPVTRETGREEGPATDSEDLRVLVVSASNEIRLSLSEQIGSWATVVKAVKSWEEALTELGRAQAGNEAYSLALFDLPLAEEGLREAQNAVERGSWHTSTLAVFFAWADPRPAKQKMRRWSVRLAKPIRPSRLREDLLRVWKRWLQGSPGEPEANHARRWEPEGSADLVPATAARPRVLLAEDNMMNQKVGVLLLEKLGYRVDLAANGKEALAMFEMLPYDLVLMDCYMPEVDGFEAARGIRESEAAKARARIPIIAVTANAAQGQRQRCLEAGMDDYITKPIQLEALKALLARWVPLQMA